MEQSQVEEGNYIRRILCVQFLETSSLVYFFFFNRNARKQWSFWAQFLKTQLKYNARNDRRLITSNLFIFTLFKNHCRMELTVISLMICNQCGFFSETFIFKSVSVVLFISKLDIISVAQNLNNNLHWYYWNILCKHVANGSKGILRSWNRKKTLRDVQKWL